MRKLSKILALVLVLMMAFAVVSAFSFTSSAAPEKLYLTPSANWKEGNARFAAYFFGNGEKWVSMTDSDKDGVYEVAVPAGYPNVIFCRMNPSASANNWNNKWNQTADLVIPTSGANHYTVKEGTWDKGGGTWSTFGSTCAHANLGPAATCTTAQECKDCGDPVVSALGHTYNAAHLCTRCNEQATFTVAGSGAHLGTEWDTGNTANDMTYADGVYTKVYTNVAAGSYMLKVARDHDWGTAYPSADKAYTVATAGSTVTVTLKGTTVTVTVDAPHVCNFVAGEVVAPTYDAEGYTVYTCSCGKTENRDFTAKKELPKFPEAVVTPVEDTGLTFALNFGIKGVSIVDGEIVLDPEVITEEYIAEVLEVYGRMYVDYRLTVEGLSTDKLVLNANGEADGFLGGQYDAWSENWVYVPFEDVVIENGKSLMIMEYAASMMGQAGLRQILAEIVSVVVDFDCGVYFTPEFMEANPDMVITLELIVFNEDENGELTDVITVAENVFTLPHEHTFVEGVCECGELDPEYVNTLVVGDTNKIIVNGDYFNEYGLPIEWIVFVADEKAHYEFVGNNGALCFIFDGDLNLLCLGTGKADLEAGAYLICVGNGATGVLNVAVTKSEIAVPEHENKLVIGENNKIVVDGSILNANGNPIAWVPFVVEEKAHYAMTSEDPTALVYIFDANLNLLCGGTGAAVLEPGTYLVCVGNAQIGDIYVQVTKTEIPTVCEHVYVYMNCSLCGEANPYFAHNLMVVGTNKVVCNEYHLVDTTGHGNPYQFTTFTVTEDGHYKFTSDKLIGFTIFTTEVNAEGADWTAGSGASWGAYIAGNEVDLAAGTYYIGMIFVDGVGEYEVTLEKVAPQAPVVEEEPVEELNWFQKIIAWFVELINKLLAIFKK